jgi:hypothetical protein
MCLGRRDDRDLGFDPRFARFRPGDTDESRSDQGQTLHGAASPDAEQGGKKTEIVTTELGEMAVVERLEPADGSDRLEPA